MSYQRFENLILFNVSYLRCMSRLYCVDISLILSRKIVWIILVKSERFGDEILKGISCNIEVLKKKGAKM